MKDFQRARQPEQKEERRAHLLTTTRAMLEGGVDLRSLSLNELARRAGMAKSNVYRYFETREAVLLALMWEEMTGWGEQMTRTLRRPTRGRPALDALVGHLARTLAARPMFCALLAAFPSVLERNLSEEMIRDFKTRALRWVRELGLTLTEHVPTLSAEQYAALFYDAIAVIAGVYPDAYSTGAAARVAAEPAFRSFRRDLPRDLERFLLALAHEQVRMSL